MNGLNLFGNEFLSDHPFPDKIEMQNITSTAILRTLKKSIWQELNEQR